MVFKIKSITHFSSKNLWRARFTVNF